MPRHGALDPCSGTSAQRGASLVEILVFVVLLGIVVLIAAGLSPTMLGREDSRGAASTVQAFAQLARMEAVGRNHACLFAVDAASRTLEVVDLNNPADPADDLLISRTQLSSRVRFAAPSGTAISLATLSTGRYGTVFTSDGAVQSGAGFVSIGGGERFDRVTIYGAGGMAAERWDGSSWVTGS